MTYKEKIDYIKKTFGFSDTKLKTLLGFKNDVNLYKEDPKIIDVIAAFFHIPVEELSTEKSLSLLHYDYMIDKSKYKNAMSIYSEVLKEFFSKNDIYILTKIKYRNKINNFLSIFFNSGKAETINMKTFSPSYLIENGHNLLVNIDSEKMSVYELPINMDKKEFIFNNYRYKRANKIKI